MKLFRRKSRDFDRDKFLKIDHLAKNLKGHTVRGGAVTISAQALKFVLRMGSTVFLARLLTPEDYGLFGMVTVVIGFVELFKDLGLSAATVQKVEINHTQVSTLFWINLLISIVISILFAAIAPLIAWFYSEPRLIAITLALSTTFIFSGLTVQHQALLRRQMQFGTIAVIEIVSMIAGILAALISAWYGAGYWALIYMQLATVVSNLLGVWLLCSWRPGRPKQDSDVASMLKFGGNLTGFRCVNYFSRNSDNILIGRVWGAQSLGLYSKAYQLLLLPITQINGPVYNVALSALSRLQSEPERYKASYCKAILSVTTISMPLVAFTAVMADKIVLVMLGPQWSGVVPIFRFLMPAAFFTTFNIATGWVYQSLGRTDRQLRWGVVSSTLTIIAFLVGNQWGAVGVAAAYGITYPLILMAEVVYCYSTSPLKPLDLATTLFKPAFSSLGAATLLYLINNSLNFFGNSDFILIIISLGLYFIFYISLWMVIPNGRKTLFEMISNLKLMKRSK